MNRFTLLLCSVFFFQCAFSQAGLQQEKIKWLAFQWNDPKEKDAVFLKSRLDTFDYNFNWQLDTGSPYTFINGATWTIFSNRFPVMSALAKRTDTVRDGNYYKVATPPFTFYGKRFLPDVVLKNDNMGGGFPGDYLDTYRGAGFQIGTIGLDMFKDKVLILNFRDNQIGFGDSLSSSFYSKTRETTPFTFYKNRIIIPVQIGKEKVPFMYDCGASMFTLQTTPKHSVSFRPAVYSDTLFNINNGETGEVHNVAGGFISKPVKLLGKTFTHMVVYVENGESDIFDEAKVAGIIGNKLFLDHTIIIDFKKRMFTLMN